MGMERLRDCAAVLETTGLPSSQVPAVQSISAPMYARFMDLQSTMQRQAWQEQAAGQCQGRVLTRMPLLATCPEGPTSRSERKWLSSLSELRVV